MLNLDLNNYLNGQFFKIRVPEFLVNLNNGYLLILLISIRSTYPQKYIPFTDVPYIRGTIYGMIYIH